MIVIGSGAAGLTAAIAAARDHGAEVLLLTKGRLGESNTSMAQGGIAAALFDDDSVDAHAADTMLAGAGLSDPRAVHILCAEGPERVRDLIELSMPFDRTADGATLARGLEGAHSVARVVHAGGDMTGRAMIATLTAALRSSRVRVLEHAFVCDLMMRRDAVAGVTVMVDGRQQQLAADAVIIATGGAGQLYRHTSNPPGATGDGVAAAMRAGARVVDAEFMQFHPTTLAVEGTPLVSEAVRGDGAVLLDSAGARFMTAVHADAELAPRDIVARAIARQMGLQGGLPVLLDARAIGADTLARRFPGFWALCAANGLDPARHAVPVTPAAHYWMGGIEVDSHGRTGIRGLFAVGEAACTGAHGGNRLASNSLLEALVTGHRAAGALGQPWPSLPRAEPAMPGGSRELTRPQLQQLMWAHAGLERSAQGLAEASAVLSVARVRGDTIADLETANLLTIAHEVVAAAAARTASLGAHHRSDDPAAARPHDREVSIAC